MMTRKQVIVAMIAVTLILSGIHYLLPGPRTVPEDKKGKLKNFIKSVVVDTLERDYRSHGIAISVLVTDVTIGHITKKETDQDNVYFAQGRVSYRIEGKRTWHDKEGNVIQLGPEQEITHWYSCGILEDRYLGAFFIDNKNLLTFYADNPMQ